MRKIFLDCGAWNGCSVRHFRKYYPECAEDYEFFCFEPDPANLEYLRDVPNVNVIEKAVSVEDGEKKFYLGDYTESGSLFKNKTTGGVDPNKFITVHTIDLPRFIKDNFMKDDDFIILKLNVEGAEYDILEAMEKINMLVWIDVYFIQWHWNKLRGFPKQRHDRVSKLVTSHPWQAMLDDPKHLKQVMDEWC